MNILMIVAHPDDEILFGYHDIYHNKVDVICLTSKSDNIRSNEFYKCMDICNLTGTMFDLPDSSTNTWTELTDSFIIDTYIQPLLNKSYDMIVSHGEDGEYGNLQHIRVNSIAKSFAKIINKPFMTFFSRFDINDYKNNDYVEKRKKLLDIYVSQHEAIKAFTPYFYNKVKFRKLKYKYKN